MSSNKLQVLAAHHVLGCLESWELPRIADALLNDGIYSDTLVQLAEVRDPIMSRVAPLLERSLSELEVILPTFDQATWIALRHYMPIASERIDPRRGLHAMMSNVYRQAKLCEKSNRCLGDSHDVNGLIATFYEYDDLPDYVEQSKLEEETRKLDSEAIQFAREWLAAHGDKDATN